VTPRAEPRDLTLGVTPKILEERSFVAHSAPGPPLIPPHGMWA